MTCELIGVTFILYLYASNRLFLFLLFLFFLVVVVFLRSRTKKKEDHVIMPEEGNGEKYI